MQHNHLFSLAQICSSLNIPVAACFQQKNFALCVFEMQCSMFNVLVSDHRKEKFTRIWHRVWIFSAVNQFLVWLSVWVATWAWRFNSLICSNRLRAHPFVAIWTLCRHVSLDLIRLCSRIDTFERLYFCRDENVRYQLVLGNKIGHDLLSVYSSAVLNHFRNQIRGFFFSW